MTDHPALSGWTQCDCHSRHRKKAGGVKGRGVGDVMTDAVTGVMSFEDEEQCYTATRTEYGQSLNAERIRKQIPPQSLQKDQPADTLA